MRRNAIVEIQRRLFVNNAVGALAWNQSTRESGSHRHTLQCLVFDTTKHNKGELMQMFRCLRLTMVVATAFCGLWSHEARGQTWPNGPWTPYLCGYASQFGGCPGCFYIRLYGCPAGSNAASGAQCNGGGNCGANAVPADCPGYECGTQNNGTGYYGYGCTGSTSSCSIACDYYDPNNVFHSDVVACVSACPGAACYS